MSLDFSIASLSAVVAAAIALLVLFGGKRSAAHWFFSAGLLVLASESICVGLASDSIIPAQHLFWLQCSFVFQALIPLPWIAFSLVYARGDIREQLFKYRALLIASFIVPLALIVVFRGHLIKFVPAAGGEGWIPRLGPAGSAFSIVFLVAVTLVLLNLERTFRASVGTMRWRIKFMILGLGVLFIVRAYTSSQALLFHSVDLSWGLVNNAALGLGCLILLRALFRTGNFEVSVYPSQFVIAHSFTVLLAGVYLLLVGVLAKVVSWLGGDSSFALKAFVVLIGFVLLATLLLSDRLKLRLRQFVSRHFHRPVHDYRGIWEKVTQASARCVDQAELCSTISKIASEIFQALSVTIWLTDSRRAEFALCASTSISETGAAKLKLDQSEAAVLISALAANPEPIDIESRSEAWAAVLRRIHPDQFHKGGNRVCVPILASGELLGLLAIGDRVGGVPFGVQDMELLKSLSGHVAADLLNIQLSQKLAQAKQLEAFQAMSAFFVHDLKNTASTLSLMLKNLPVHYQDPAFMEDALRGISRTVDHVNEIISRLNSLRQELAIKPVDCDLNQLVLDSLQGQEQMPGVEVLKILNPLPRLRVDPIQVQKVLINLLLNSRDAMPSGGQIKVETRTQNGWAVLSVSDNGCGMSQEFIQRSLFRPFQTTKKRGIGIGMFHCKMIVDAHNGRIEVDSEPGNGTAFRVLLPLPPAT